MNRDEVVTTLRECHRRLNDSLIDIINENKDGQQFDYCTHPDLADEVLKLSSTIKNIYGKVFQKY